MPRPSQTHSLLDRYVLICSLPPPRYRSKLECVCVYLCTCVSELLNQMQMSEILEATMLFQHGQVSSCRILQSLLTLLFKMAVIY
jgi:hypothetical protein